MLGNFLKLYHLRDVERQRAWVLAQDAYQHVSSTLRKAVRIPSIYFLSIHIHTSSLSFSRNLILNTQCTPIHLLTYTDRERVLILGSGWSGFTLSRQLDPKKYQTVVISPRSYFVFTPLLASTAVGTLEFRSALEWVFAFLLWFRRGVDASGQELMRDLGVLLVGAESQGGFGVSYSWEGRTSWGVFANTRHIGVWGVEEDGEDGA